jgi:2-keto-myo-inositol isomerase
MTSEFHLYPALNAATAGSTLPVDEYVALAARQGFRWAEFDSGQVTQLVMLGPSEAENLLTTQNVGISSFFLSMDWSKDEETHVDAMRRLSRLADVTSCLGARRCCTWVVPNWPTTPSESRRWIGRRLRAVAELLSDYGMELGIEFVGPTHFLMDEGYTFLYGIEEMLAFAKEIGSNVGILVDSFHWHSLGSTEAALAALPARRITYLHISDAPNVPREQQQDHIRLLPGAGIIDLCGFLRGVVAAGYTGPVGIEVHGTSLTNLSPDEAAARAYRSWRLLLEKCEGKAGVGDR